MTRIAVIPGDGIGLEVVEQAVGALREAAEVTGRPLELDAMPYGAEHYLRTGETLPASALDRLRAYDAILLGALGDPRVPDNRHAAEILFGIRFGLDLYVNHRPVRLIDERVCPLKDRTTGQIKFAMLREK